MSSSHKKQYFFVWLITTKAFGNITIFSIAVRIYLFYVFYLTIIVIQKGILSTVVDLILVHCHILIYCFRCRGALVTSSDCLIFFLVLITTRLFQRVLSQLSLTSCFLQAHQLLSSFYATTKGQLKLFINQRKWVAVTCRLWSLLSCSFMQFIHYSIT